MPLIFLLSGKNGISQIHDFSFPEIRNWPTFKDLGNRRNCRHVYCFQAGTTAIAAAAMLYSLEADPVDTAIMQPQGLLRWSLYIFTEQKWSVAKQVHRDMHVQCYK